MTSTAPSPPPGEYPKDLERRAALRDGTTVGIRPIRPADAAGLIAMYDRLSHHTAYQRFFSVMRRLPPDWARLLANVDYQRRLALVAEHEAPSGPELIAVARYEPTEEPGMVEVAFVVQDGWQNRGLGTILLDARLAAAEARGVRRFSAYVLADNQRMLDMLARFTDVERRTLASGVVEITFRARRRTGAPRAGPHP
jgi:RimJ/RimL family protein N-acetyltransferase